MATQSAVFKFALPEDENSDQMRIYSSTTQTGTFTLVTTVAYAYGDSTYELDTLDDTTWYKIQFLNSVDSEAGPMSDPVYGGKFSDASPFLAVSTGTDGANYATIQDLYDYSGLTAEDVSAGKCSIALRRARAVIDLKTADLNLNRFTATFGTETSRKKFNATLRIVREAEINIALGNVYKSICDDILMKRAREYIAGDTDKSGTISVGSTTISESVGGNGGEQIRELGGLANRYLSVGAALLSALLPPSVELRWKTDGAVGVFPFKLTH